MYILEVFFCIIFCCLTFGICYITFFQKGRTENINSRFIKSSHSFLRENKNSNNLYSTHKISDSQVLISNSIIAWKDRKKKHLMTQSVHYVEL